MIEDKAEKLSQIHCYVQQIGFRCLLSPVQAPTSISAHGFLAHTLFFFPGPQ